MYLLEPYYDLAAGGETAFSTVPLSVTFGPGVLAEAGAKARALGIKRALLIADPAVARLAPFEQLHASLTSAGIDLVVHAAIDVEPTDRSILEAAAIAREARVDGIVSLGGGSTIDTAKAANLFATYPAPFLDYVNAPIGAGRAVPGPLPPHIACPTTFGTAAETTAISVFDILGQHVKTSIVSSRIRPTLGLLDPTTLISLPPLVLAANGFDVLSHAIESYTARPYTARPAVVPPGAERPASQGANPFSSLACLEAVRMASRHLPAAVNDPTDHLSRQGLMFAGLLAGIGFGNAGNHLPHALSYPIAAQVRDYHAPDYPAGAPHVPHGIAVGITAPAAFQYVAASRPDRFGAVLEALGGGMADGLVGVAVAERLAGLMRTIGLPNGLSGVGYGPDDIPSLAKATLLERRLVENAPIPVGFDDLAAICRTALRYW